MRWLERHAWWALLLFALLFVIFGVTDIAAGPAADPAIPLGLTGMTVDELPPPPPMVSGPIIAALSGAILLVTAPRFFRGAEL